MLSFLILFSVFLFFFRLPFFWTCPGPTTSFRRHPGSFSFLLFSTAFFLDMPGSLRRVFEDIRGPVTNFYDIWGPIIMVDFLVVFLRDFCKYPQEKMEEQF